MDPCICLYLESDVITSLKAKRNLNSAAITSPQKALLCQGALLHFISLYSLQTTQIFSFPLCAEWPNPVTRTIKDPAAAVSTAALFGASMWLEHAKNADAVELK